MESPVSREVRSLQRRAANRAAVLRPELAEGHGRRAAAEVQRS